MLSILIFSVAPGESVALTILSKWAVEPSPVYDNIFTKTRADDEPVVDRRDSGCEGTSG